jgi:hypothetical protein
MTKVTIGPDVMTRTAVISKKAANSSQFMTTSGRCAPVSSSAKSDDPADDLYEIEAMSSRVGRAV